MGNQQSSTDYKERLGRNKVVMDRLRKSFRESFRRRKDHTPECSKPHQWQADESAVRAGTCSFQVKYLGCVEVFESRGMQVCEEALKVLRNSRRRPIRGTLYVTGDGLRVVDDETKGLIVDQTIEKVSFCAPDRNHEKGFSYICRDGTTRRWMCHGFLAIKDSGERLSHAVGCAFAVCLEKKQKRDKESVMMNFDPKTSTFTRTGSFRQSTMTERIQDPDHKIPEKIESGPLPIQESSDNKGFSVVNENVVTEPPPAPPLKAVHNPYAIERPHATPMLLQRQGSFRGFGALNQTSPFKRQLSLRINELPSTLDRQRAMSLESSDIFSCQNGLSVTPIPESSPVTEKDSLSAVCQQVSQGLSLLSGDDDDDAFLANNRIPTQVESYRQSNVGNPWTTGKEPWVTPTGDYQSAIPKSNSNPSDIALSKPPLTSPPPVPLSSLPISHQQPVAPPRRSSPNFSHLRSQSVGSAEAFYLTAAATKALGSSTSTSIPSQPAPHLPSAPKNPYEWSSHQSSYQIGQGNSGWTNGSTYNQVLHQQQMAHQSQASGGSFADPFDAEWAAPAAGASSRASTNPFVQNSVKTFEVQM